MLYFNGALYLAPNYFDIYKQQALTSVNEIIKTKTNAYPNPFINKVNISAEDIILHASVYSASGKLMLDTIENSKNIELNLQQLKAGIYFIRVQTESQIETIRIVKH